MKTKLSGEKWKKSKTEEQVIQPRSLSAAWPSFVKKLASTLALLEEDQMLILSPKRSNVCVQFAGQGAFGIRTETTSDFYRDPADQLSELQIAGLTSMGWNPPTRNPEESTPENDPDGSPNFWLDSVTPVDFLGLARLAVDTLIEILGISHPGFLQYSAFYSGGDSIPLPQLGLKREISDDEYEKNTAEALPKLLLETVKELTGIDDWRYDEDGDIGGICYGSASTYVRLLEDRPYIHMHAVVLRDVESTFQLLQRVNKLNMDNGHLHLFIRNNAVVAVSDVLVTPFVTSIVAHGLSGFCQIADELSQALNAEFGEDAESTNQSTNQVVH